MSIEGVGRQYLAFYAITPLAELQRISLGVELSKDKNKEKIQDFLSDIMSEHLKDSQVDEKSMSRARELLYMHLLASFTLAAEVVSFSRDAIIKKGSAVQEDKKDDNDYRNN